MGNPLSLYEQSVISRFALKEQFFRDEAISIYHDLLDRLSKEDLDSNVYVRFMSEMDNPCPDYGLRAMYREQIVKIWNEFEKHIGIIEIKGDRK